MRDWWKGRELQTVLQPMIWPAELNCLMRATLAKEVQLVYLAQRGLSLLGSPSSWKNAVSWQLPAAAPLETTTATFKLRSSQCSTHTTQWLSTAGLPNPVTSAQCRTFLSGEFRSGASHWVGWDFARSASSARLSLSKSVSSPLYFQEWQIITQVWSLSPLNAPSSPLPTKVLSSNPQLIERYFGNTCKVTHCKIHTSKDYSTDLVASRKGRFWV